MINNLDSTLLIRAAWRRGWEAGKKYLSSQQRQAIESWWEEYDSGRSGGSIKDLYARRGWVGKEE